MIRLRVRDSLRRDEGVAMIFVIAIGMIVAILAAAMFASVLQNQKTTRTHRNVTSAQAAAEAALDDAVYQLGLAPGGTPNWTTWKNTYTDQAHANALNFGNNNASASAWVIPVPSSNNLYVYARGQYGSNTRTIRATVAQGSPPAFDFSMFASKGIDIHQHGGWLSPQVWTTSVHSNGYINIDYPSQFTFNKMEAVGNLTFEKGGGKIPSGTVGANGYSWLDPLNGMCYPGGYASPGGIDPQGGPCPNSYPGTAELNGSVYAGSITMGSHGVIKAVPSPPITLDTGQVIDGGDINGSVETASSNINCATSCSKPNPVGGQIQGTVTMEPSGWTPAVIPFPSIDLATVYGNQKAGLETNNSVDSPTVGGTNHFTSPSQFLTWATTHTRLLYNADSNGQLTRWDQTQASMQHYPDVILLQGDFDISGGSLTLNFQNIQSAVQAETGLKTGGAPIIIVQGSLVADSGSISLSTGLVVMGSDNPYQGVVIPASGNQPTHINTAALVQNSAVQPGVLAAGGTISSNDYDTDSPWTSTSTYEPMKAAPVYVRGLVYSALYNASTGTSTPENQHWHNFDPKNLMKIYGAQVGADLHDCNNFNFTYDPIVKNAFGFGGGSVKVIDYQELGT